MEIKCQKCGEFISASAEECPHCGLGLTPEAINKPKIIERPTKAPPPRPKKPSIKAPRHSKICQSCGYVGGGVAQEKGNTAIEIILWLFYLIPGIIYSIWRRSGAKQLLCPDCNCPVLIPVITKKGEELLLQFYPPEEQLLDSRDWGKINQAISQLFRQYCDIINCLVFIGKSDGQLREAERDIIIDVCLSLLTYKKIPRYELDNAIKEIKQISNEEFKSAVNRIANQSEREKKILADAGQMIIGTQNTVSAGEEFCTQIINNAMAVR